MVSSSTSCWKQNQLLVEHQAAQGFTELSLENFQWGSTEPRSPFPLGGLMPTRLRDSLWSGREELVGLYKSWAIFRERQQGKLGRNKHRKTEGKGLLKSVTPNTGLHVSPCWISSGWCWPSPVQVPLNKQPPAHWLLAVICNLGILHRLLQVTDKC